MEQEPITLPNLQVKPQAKEPVTYSNEHLSRIVLRLVEHAGFSDKEVSAMLE